MPDHKAHPVDLTHEYPPYAMGLDPVTIRPETGALGAANFTTPTEPARRDPYFGNPITDGPPTPRRSDFSVTTWAMIVVAGIVLGAAVALMAAGA